MITRYAALSLLLAVAAPATAQQAGPAAAPFGGPALEEKSLGSVTGREGTSVQAAEAQQAATVSRNTVGDNSRTGEARISDNAFQNMQGLSILNVNTGNNVAINAAMNVNISLTH